MITERQYAAALARGRARLERELVAAAVRYDAGQDALAITLASGLVVGVPRRQVAALVGLAPDMLASMALSPAGTGIDIDGADVSLSVDGLIRPLLPDAVIRRWAARLSGAARSPAKAAAARRNGRKGGRPRKKRAVAARSRATAPAD